jgi:hypothetical protein
LRKDYNVTPFVPFVYEPAWYEREYEKAKTDYRLKRVENKQHPKRSDSDAPWRLPFLSLAKIPSPSKFLAIKSSGRGANEGSGSLPFRKGSGGDPASAVCLICAWQGDDRRHDIESTSDNMIER